MYEFLPACAAVDIRSFKNARIDTEYTGDQEQCGVSIPHPELNEGYYSSCRTGIVNKESVIINDARAQKPVSDRTVGTEQGEEEYRDRSSGDDIGQIDHYLENTLPFELDLSVGEPDGKEQ